MTNSCPKAVEQNARPDMKMLTTARDKDVVTWHETISSRARARIMMKMPASMMMKLFMSLIE